MRLHLPSVERRRSPGLTAALALLVAGSPLVLAAQPACVGGTIADYAALGAGGCRLGGVTFALPVVPHPSLAMAALTPTTATIGGSGWVGVRLTLGPDFSFAAGDGDPGGAYGDGFAFTATGAYDRARVGELVATLTASGTRRAFAGEGIAETGILETRGIRRVLDGAGPATTGCFVGIHVLTPGTPCADPELTLDQTVTHFFLFGYGVEYFAAPVSGSGTAAVTSAELLFRTTAGATTAPEPATLALVGGGLVALAGAARARRRQRA